MEREHNETGLIELGRASTVTQGQVIPAEPEAMGYYRLQGLLTD